MCIIGDGYGKMPVHGFWGFQLKKKNIHNLCPLVLAWNGDFGSTNVDFFFVMRKNRDDNAHPAGMIKRHCKGFRVFN